MIGELSLAVSSGHFYVEGKHVSGLNTPERDGGFNAAFVGLQDDIGPIHVKVGAGLQAQSAYTRTNNYGHFVTDVSASYEWEGLFIKAGKAGNMEMVTTGFVKRW